MQIFRACKILIRKDREDRATNHRSTVIIRTGERVFIMGARAKTTNDRGGGLGSAGETGEEYGKHRF